MKKVKHPNDLKVGDKILIERTPELWSHKLNPNYPLRLSFPREVEIKKMEYFKISGSRYLAMTCGEYGWSVKSIIDAGCYILNEGVEVEDLIEIL